MVGNGAVEEGWVGIVDNLLEDEVLQLNTRSEGGIQGLVARSELGALGDGVVVSTPDELDGITDGGVDGEGDVTEDTLGRSDPDDVSLSGLGGRSVFGFVLGRSQRGVLGLALLDTVVVWVTPPGVASRSIGRLRVIDGGRGTVLGRVGVGRGTVLRSVRIVRRVGVGGSGSIRRECLVLAIICGERGRGTPGVRRPWLIGGRSWRRVGVGGGEHAIAVPGVLDQNGEGRSRSNYILTAHRYQT